MIYAAVLLLAAAVVFIVIDRQRNTFAPDDTPYDVRSHDPTEDPGLSSDASSSGRSNDPDNASGFGDMSETVGQSDPSGEPNTSGLPVTTETPGTSGNTETSGDTDTEAAPDSSGAHENSGSPETSAYTDTTSTTETGNAPVTSDHPETSGTPVTSQPPETSRVPDTAQTPVTTQVPDTTQTTQAPDSTQAPDTTQPPDTAQLPETSQSPGTTSQSSSQSDPPAGINRILPDSPRDADGSFTITVSIAGDTQLASNWNDERANRFAVYAEREDPSYFLEKVRHIFEADDFTIVNLECVLSDNNNLVRASKSGTAYWYKGPANNINILTCSSVEGVSLANNHTKDYGQAGLEDTMRVVREAGLSMGYYYDTFCFTKNGYTVAVICDAMWNEGQSLSIEARVREASAWSDFQIVYWHGGTEYAFSPSDWQKRASYRIIDAGADLVIGAHSHVLQPMEYYKGVRIVYSLGNFCYGGFVNMRSRAGLKPTIIYQLVLRVGADGIAADVGENIIPCYVSPYDVSNFQPALMTAADEIAKVLDFMDWKRSLPE
ncbi:MAG: CapA family protein [Clostridia bacterium]|nr:CapA family protein [Clostridia bacterium]